MDLPVGLKEDQNPSLMIVKHVISSFPLHFVSFLTSLNSNFLKNKKCLKGVVSFYQIKLILPSVAKTHQKCTQAGENCNILSADML